MKPLAVKIRPGESAKTLRSQTWHDSCGHPALGLATPTVLLVERFVLSPDALL
jgi:hypothetical protein